MCNYCTNLLVADKEMIMRIDYKPIYLVITPFFPSAQSFRGPYVYDQVKAIMCDGRYRVIVMMPDSWMHKVGEYEYRWY